jgi:cytochrome c biogenesis protein
VVLEETSAGTGARDSMSTRPEEPGGPSLGALGWARWAWRQLTSMRVALILLFLLALAAVPGSLVPQRAVDPVEVARFAREHPTLIRVYEKLALFDVFSSPWFAAIYLLLFISLLGCVVPRARRHAAAMRARPPAAPRHLDRLPAYRRWESTAEAATVLAAAERVLGRRRFRRRVEGETVSAEKGYLRETGNLVFHVALIGVLVAVACGSLYGYRGNILLTEGEGFANTLTRYDDFTPGRLFDPAELSPFSFKLEDFTATYATAGPQRGQARTFEAALSYRRTPEEAPRPARIRVNHPMAVAGANVFLLGNGYAPVFTVRDGTGTVVHQGPVPFLPQDGNHTSIGVVKLADARPTQLAFSGSFLPTAARDRREGIVSVFPGPENPAVVLLAWKGDLGLDDGTPQSVYQLDTGRLERFTEGGRPLSRLLQAGDTLSLPAGAGSISYDGFRQWATFRVAHDPGRMVALVSGGVALAGLMLSLFVRRRRVWVRVSAAGGRTVVEVAGLARSESAALHEEVAAVARDLGDRPGRPAAPEHKE